MYTHTYINAFIDRYGASLMKSEFVAQRVKNLPTNRETWVQSLSREATLEKEMATHSSIIVWRVPWTEDLGSYNLWGCKESDMTEQLIHACTHTHTHIYNSAMRKKEILLFVIT